MVETHCRNCQHAIVDSGVKCAQCEDFYLCLQCFACSVELGCHKKSHNYHIFSVSPTEDEVVGADVIFSSSADDRWSVFEEDMLLDAVEHHGFGSWQEVSDYVKTKSAEECEMHFCKYYIDGNIGIATLPLEKPLQWFDHTPSNTAVIKPIDLTVPEQQELGYMALRDDFEREYDNEAEQAVCDVAIHYTDTPLDTAYKLFEVNTYRQRLRERHRRKEIGKGFSIMHNATTFGWKAYRAMWKKRTREERLFNEHYLKLGRYTTQSDYNKLRTDLIRQDKLQKHIQTLIKFNSQGYKSLHGKLKMHAIQINGCLNAGKKRKKKHRRYYR